MRHEIFYTYVRSRPRAEKCREVEYKKTVSIITQATEADGPGTNKEELDLDEEAAIKLGKNLAKQNVDGWSKHKRLTSQHTL